MGGLYFVDRDRTMNTKLLLSFVVLYLVVCTIGVQAQKKARLGKVCGNPNVACKGGENFQVYDLRFDTGKNSVIAESVPFYAIVLKSHKYENYSDCEKAFPETERLATQELFPNNKVFAVRCSEAGENYYKGMNQGIVFLA